eukprot:scaffold40183_cov25-Tisochrysis_lutea.AAC.1
MLLSSSAQRAQAARGAAAMQTPAPTPRSSTRPASRMLSEGERSSTLRTSRAPPATIARFPPPGGMSEE